MFLNSDAVTGFKVFNTFIKPLAFKIISFHIKINLNHVIF